MSSAAQTSRAWRPVELAPEIPKPVGAYSPAVRAGPFLYCSGQVPIDPVTGQLIGTDVATQTHQVFKNVERVLAAGGAKLSDVVACVVYLADENDWGTYNEIHRSKFEPPFPSRTALGAKLRGGVLVEVTVTAYLG